MQRLRRLRRAPATRAPSPWWTARPGSCGTITATVWATACPPAPTGAITFVEREAAAYDEQAVMENKQRKMRKEGMTLPCGCPGSQSRNIQRQDAPAVETPQAQQTSRLSQWPVQIKLVPVNARILTARGC